MIFKTLCITTRLNSNLNAKISHESIYATLCIMLTARIPVSVFLLHFCILSIKAMKNDELAYTGQTW